MNATTEVDVLLSQAHESLQAGAFGKSFEFIAKALSITPASPQGRLLLANLFYRLDCSELAVQEVRLLQQRFPERESLVRLLSSLDPASVPVSRPEGKVLEQSARDDGTKASPLETQVNTERGESSIDTEARKQISSPQEASSVAPPGKQEEVLAETDFDFDDLDLLDQ